MSSNKKFATLAFAGSESTLGLAIVCDAIRDRFPDSEFMQATHITAKEADYLLVSLYWWRDVYAFVRFLSQAGIDPRKRSPIIIIGGMMAVNPRPLDGYYHYAVVGDGEEVIADLVSAIEADEDPYSVAGVWSAAGCKIASTAKLHARSYVDLRTNKTVRIEIARGCKMSCPFCQLSYLKPYRELPLEVISHLIMTASTKNVALFAPDTWSHSRAAEIDATAAKYGKRNTGTDVRLDVIKNIKNARSVRFGVEAFSERVRKIIGKVRTNERLIDLFDYMANEMFFTSGKPLSCATCYMIGNLPTETDADVAEFWDTLAEVDKRLKRKFTLFLSVSSFAPSPHTPMWYCGIDPYYNYKTALKARPKYKNLVIASRGGVLSAPQRLSQMLTIRGDESTRRAVHYLSTDGFKFTSSTERSDGKIVEAIVRKSGFNPELLYSELDASTVAPWMNVESYSDRWRRKWNEKSTAAGRQNSAGRTTHEQSHKSA